MRDIRAAGLFAGLVILIVISVIAMQTVSAENFTIRSVSPGYLNRTINTLINFTINSTGGLNTTQVTVALPQGATFYTNSNGTDAISNIFTNATVSGQAQLTWTNITAEPLMNRSQAKSFWFNASLATAGNNIFTIVTNDSGRVGNVTTQTLTVNFAFAGFIRNETGGLHNGTNVSIYQFTVGQGGPPTEAIEASVLANGSGIFNFTSLNGSAQMYTIKFVYYNNSNSSQPAMKVGTIIPPFPAIMFYPASGLEAFDMSLDNSTFFLQAAATLRLNATNGSNTTNFGYMVMDQKVGFPIDSNILGSVATQDVVVPAGRDYTVMFMREFSQFPDLGPGICNGTFFNASNCPAPPKSNSSLGTLTGGQILQVTQNIAVTTVRLTGCIGVAARHNQTSLAYNNSVDRIIGYNITNLFTKLQPWTGFIPEMRGDMGDLNLSADISYNLTRYTQCNQTNYANGIAYYNISLLGNTPFMLEFYAKNASNEAGAGGAYLIGFQNFTTNASGNQNYNVTMYRGLGSYYTAGLGAINTTKMRINIVNETGNAVTNDMHVEVKVKNTEAGIGTVHYIIETMTNGTFYIPLLNNSERVSVSAFPNDAPPIQKVLNLSASENNITLISIEFGGEGDKGMRRMNTTGGLEQVNMSALPMQIRFLRRGTNEVITSMDGDKFNPLKALVAGSVDLELKLTSTNITMRFNNFDMFSAKQPPMFAVMDNSTMASASQSWQFGNFVPKDVYDNVTITIPYSESLVNESWSYSMSIPVLYEEDPANTHQQKAAWNISAGYTTGNLTDEFIAYNNSRYRSYLTSAGTSCSSSDTGSVCYMNLTGNEIRMEIPHFSGINPGSSGSAPSTTSSSGSGGSTSTIAPSDWKYTFTVSESQVEQGYTKDLADDQRVKFSIETDSGKEEHYVGVVELTETSATIEVASDPVRAILSVGETKKFDITENAEGKYYDLQVTLNSITNKKANVSVKKIYEKIPEEAAVGEEEAGEGEAEAAGEGIALTSKTANIIWIVALVVIVIAIVLVIWKMQRRKIFFGGKAYERR